MEVFVLVYPFMSLFKIVIFSDLLVIYCCDQQIMQFISLEY